MDIVLKTMKEKTRTILLNIIERIFLQKGTLMRSKVKRNILIVLMGKNIYPMIIW